MTATVQLPIDWAELWRAQVAAEHAQYDRLTDPEARPGADWWTALAPRFYEHSRRLPQPDALLAPILPHVRPGMRVLDVGAGTGRYALPLAAAGARVVAVEPSEAMARYLAQEAREQGLQIEIVSASWEQAQVEPAELVLCAHVLYPVADAASFLRKLDQHTLERCYIALGYESPSAWLFPFWRTVYGVERLSLPGALELPGVLQQLGIYASVTPVSWRSGFQYASYEDALQDVRARLALKPDVERDRRLLELLREALLPGYQAPLPLYQALIAWER